MDSTNTLLDFTALLLGTLGHTDGEFTAIGYKDTEDTDGVFHTAVMAPAEAAEFAATLPDTADVYFGVNPVRRMPAGRRGTATDVTRLAALWADLDVKPGGCPNIDVAEAIIAELSIALGSRPSAITHSGHGLQPYLPIADGAITDTVRAAAFLRRWGRTVAATADRHDVAVDSVFDLPRMLRVPGTFNNKGTR